MENFDPELKAYYSKIKEEIKSEHLQYMSKHPEIKDILNDFVSSLLLEKPQDIYSYTKDYFSYYNSAKEIKKQQPLIIVGPSGAGKGTIIKYLGQKFPDIFHINISWTTRKARDNEVDGVHYIFKSVEEFEKELTKGGFIQSQYIYGNYYGSSKEQISVAMNLGKILIIELDVDGALQLSNYYPSANYLFLTSDLKSLEERIKQGNKNIDDSEIRQKLANFSQQTDKIKKSGLFKQINNFNLEKCQAEIEKFIQNQYLDINFTKGSNN